MSLHSSNAFEGKLGIFKLLTIVIDSVRNFFYFPSALADEKFLDSFHIENYFKIRFNYVYILNVKKKKRSKKKKRKKKKKEQKEKYSCYTYSIQNHIKTMLNVTFHFRFV
jgi:hypothetical protein